MAMPWRWINRLLEARKLPSDQGVDPPPPRHEPLSEAQKQELKDGSSRGPGSREDSISVIDLTQTANALEVTYTVGAFLALILFFVLLVLAVGAWSSVRDLPWNHPDRMVASDGIVNESIRILLAAGMLAVGLAAVVTPPAVGTTNTQPSALGVVSFVVFLMWDVVLILWGIKDLSFRRQLFAQMAQVRKTCTDSTFADCPFGHPGPTLLEPPH
jgi:hypothetical protein